MDDDKSADQHVIAAAHHLVKALKARTSLSNEVRRTLADLDTHLAAMNEAKEYETTSLREIEGRLKSAQAKIMTLHSNCLKIWDAGPSELHEYLRNVEEIRTIIESLENMVPNKNRKQNRLANQAHSVLQMAMVRLQEEVINILAQSRQCYGHEYVSFHSCEEIVVDEESIVSIDDDSVEGTSCMESTSRAESEECVMDLVHPGVVRHIKSIADLIIKKWCKATKSVIAFYLPSQKNLFDQILEVDALFCENHGNFIKMEHHELLRNLGDSAKAIFLGLGNRIASNTSTTPFQGGENSGGIVDALNRLDISSEFSCPLTLHLQSVASILESNLDKRSNLYKDDSLKHIFLMNNIHYMVQKIKNSKIRTCFSDEWIKKHIVKYVQHEKSYQRITWIPILSLITGYEKSGKAVLKERCRNFSIAFEEVYKNQTGWTIPDIELREDLKISTAVKVVHAYRPFVGQVKKSLSDKHIKYTEDDLEKYLLDFFQGSAKSLNHHWRKR
ncbi:hypothetical protein RND71_029664 [Anisodus tanguticus]|uniref:Exocyst subunit Exo70 family protein n=1 Tax=Anisodus tanguticus TaxID=243964 RepID=A0AAE1V4S6_9SOLA|nr:hypothetical protein RND71_029664 [Anisodus tanguticus]